MHGNMNVKLANIYNHFEWHVSIISMSINTVRLSNTLLSRNNDEEVDMCLYFRADLNLSLKLEGNTR